MEARNNIRLPARWLLAAICSFPCHGEIIVDGSVGQSSGEIPLGPNKQFEIREDVGRTVGSNLFHSFAAFNIAEGETASFTGVSPIENILSRVTGASPSNIDGTLRTDFANSAPNLFLINPAGVLFGPHASLDVQGSFHVSTADFLRLEDGVRFTSFQSAEDQVLTTAPPAAFGFLGDNPGSISFKGSGSLIAETSLLLNGVTVPDGETLSIIGGDIDVASGALSDNTSANARLQAPKGRINIASVASPGEIDLDDLRLSDNAFEQLGRISLAENSEVNLIGDDGEGIFILGGEFRMDSTASINSASDDFGAGDGAPISITATELNLIGGSQIGSGTGLLSSGRGGSVDIRASSSILISGSDPLRLNFSGIFSNASDGSAGTIDLNTPELRMVDGGIIGGDVLLGAGKAADINLEVAKLEIQNLDPNNLTIVSSQALPGSMGILGNIDVKASEFVSISGPNTGIRSVNTTQFDAGTISMEAPKISLVNGARIISRTLADGNAANILLDVENFELTDGASIDSASGGFLGIQPLVGNGKGGNISIKNANVVSISNGPKTIINGIEVLNCSLCTSTSGTGDAGSVDVDTSSLIIDNAAISLSSSGSGDSGIATIDADKLISISGTGGISATTQATSQIGGVEVGDAGSIIIPSNPILSMDGDVTIETTTIGDGNAGIIDIRARRLELTDGAQIGTSSGIASIETGSAFAGKGKGGTLRINSDDVIISGRNTNGIRSGLFSETGGIGDAGSINLTSQSLKIEKQGLISTRSGGDGNAGTIEIRNGNLFMESAGEISSGTGILVGDILFAGSGLGGTIKITDAKNISLSDPGTTISTQTRGSSSAGNIEFDADRINLSNNALVSSESTGIGNAGNITMGGVNDFRSDGGILTTEADQADGGNITLKVNNQVELKSSLINTSVGAGSSGGNINIDPRFVILDNSDIIAQAGAGGTGGKITIVSDFVLRSSDTVIDASAGPAGIDGTVDIDSPDTNISGSLAVLPETYINAGDQLSERCGARSANLNSFVVKGRGAVPLKPQDFTPARSLDSKGSGVLPNEESKTATDLAVSNSDAAGQQSINQSDYAGNMVKAHISNLEPKFTCEK